MAIFNGKFNSKFNTEQESVKRVVRPVSLRVTPNSRIIYDNSLDEYSVILEYIKLVGEL